MWSHMITSVNPLRLGVVPYLNVQPLIWTLQSERKKESPRVDILAARPRELAAQLELGKHHAAIVPVFEYLCRPDLYNIVPSVSIAAREEVYSVLLFSSVEVDAIKRVHLDPASLTSVNLLKVLLAEREIKPEFTTASWQPGSLLARGDAALLIGDPAIQERDLHPFQYDLGVLWKALTSRPFVFAAWLVHRAAWDLPLNELLLTAKEAGVERFEEIAREAGPQFGVLADEALRYYRENLCYDLGPEEMAGWRRFAELCAKHGLSEGVPEFRMHNH